MVKLLIVGPNGAMGRALVRRAAEDPRIEIVGGVGPKGRDYIGLDLGLLVGVGHPLGVPVADSLEAAIDDCDVVLECTRPEVSMMVLTACLEHGKSFVTGTTGFSAEQIERIKRAGRSVAVVQASNGSRVVHLLFDLIRSVTRMIGKRADIDIIELHSRAKLDAPSGTALEIGQIIADELGRELDEIAEHGREGLGTRRPNSLQFSAIRSGGARSTHQVIFGLEHERLELTHRTYDTEAFADGLIEAALFAGTRTQGFFTLDEIL